MSLVKAWWTFQIGMLFCAGASAQTVSLVNLIPASKSGEFYQDSETTLAVHPTDASRMAAAAITNDPNIGPKGPIYVTADGGSTWAIVHVVPSTANATYPYVDPSLSFAGSGVLYAALLLSTSARDYPLGIFRKPNYLNNVMMAEFPNVRRTGVDQPHIQSLTIQVNGVNRNLIFVGNDYYRGNPNGRTATVDQFNFGTARFDPILIESRDTSNRDGAPVRVAIHTDQTVYAVFFARRTQIASGPDQGRYRADVVVVSDRIKGTGVRTFDKLKELPSPPGDARVGMRVAEQVLLPPTDITLFGQDRAGADMAIAVSPKDSARAYLAWGDLQNGIYTLHLHRSLDGGKTWVPVGTRPNAKNPALAVNVDGKVAFFSQQFQTTSWESRVELSSDDFATPPTAVVLARTPANNPPRFYKPYLGDYTQLRAVGRTFYGVFSASNEPKRANFPSGVTYQRKVQWGATPAQVGQLLDAAGNPGVALSIDPFFFKVVP